MKKITLLFAFAVVFAFKTNAQVFSENFDSGSDLTTLGWITIDNDGQTPNGQVSFVTDGWNNMDRDGASTPYGGPAGNFAPMSTSWYDPLGQSDDWLISPSITLPANPATLVWDAKAQDPGFADGYELRISTTAGTTIGDFPTVLFSIPEEVANAGNVYTTRTVDLSAYAGQTVRFAWVNNSNDKFILVIDNISVVTCAPVSNLAANNITTTSADITWDAVPNSMGYEYVIDTNMADPAGAGSAITLNSYSAGSLIPNTNYYAHIRNNCGGGSFSSWTTISFLTLPVPPPNDDCTGAIALTVGNTFDDNDLNSTNLGASSDALVPSCQVNIADNVWFSFVVPAGGNVTIETQENGGMEDSVITAYTGTCNSKSFTEIGCDDDTGLGFMSKLELTGLIAGETVYISLWRFSFQGGGDNGSFLISVYGTPPPPANDECIGAIPLTVGGAFDDNDIVGTNLEATTVAGLTPSCQNNFANEVWYSAVVPASGNLTLETQGDGGMTDTIITAHTGACNSKNFVEVGCDDDSGVDFYSLLELSGLTPGETIYIGVWKYSFNGGGTDGSFLLSAYDPLLDTDTFSSQNFTAYPNPVKDKLYLSYDKTLTSFAVYNLLGQEVLSSTLNTNAPIIDFSSLNKGVYLVKVISNNEIKTIKVIKE